MRAIKCFAMLAALASVMMLSQKATAVPVVSGNWIHYYSYDNPFNPVVYSGSYSLTQAGVNVAGSYVMDPPFPATGSVIGNLFDVGIYHFITLTLTQVIPIGPSVTTVLTGLVDTAGTAMGGTFTQNTTIQGQTTVATGSWHAVRVVPEPSAIAALAVGFGGLILRRRK